MTHEIVKPFGISIEQAFLHIDVMAKLLEYFPPPSNKGKSATHAQWTRFESIRVAKKELKRKMKWFYNLVRHVFHLNFMGTMSICSKDHRE